MQNPLRIVTQRKTGRNDFCRYTGQRRQEDILCPGSLHLQDLRRKIRIRCRIRRLPHILQAIGTHRLFIPRQTILPVLIILIDDARSRILDTQLINHVIEGILSLQPIGRADENKILLTCQSRG